MTILVSYIKVGITMDGLSTITQKGQIVIPAIIRKHLNLKPSTRVYITVSDKRVVVKPVLTVDQAYGMIKTKKHYSEKDYDRAIEQAVVEKFRKKLK